MLVELIINKYLGFPETRKAFRSTIETSSFHEHQISKNLGGGSEVLAIPEGVSEESQGIFPKSSI